jgi:hypothetical protein
MIRDRLLAILLLCASGAASADTVRYDFQNYNGNILAPASGPAHLQASPVSVSGPGICWNTSLATTNDFACGGFGSSTVSFIVTPDAGWVFDVLGFSFQGLGTDPDYGPTGFGVYSSLDGFGSALISGSLVGQVTNQRYDYDAGLGATGLGGPLELRVVSTGRDAGMRSAWLLDNLHLEVALRPVNDVAEPGSLALAAVALSGLLAAGRRRAAGHGGARA